ncbi:MAG: HDOD domain-containing protein [Chitinispirillaceae bacterium]|nr:HDOD domain-containing protein [Chitinispirillaceae bacterium]
MPIIFLSINNPKESVSLKQFLIRNNIQVVTFLATYSSYIKGLRYDPDLVVSEFVEQTKNEYFNFLKAKNDNPMIKKVPFICYGDECDSQSLNTIREFGIDVYIKRPINPQILIAILAKVLSVKTNNNSNNTSFENKKVVQSKDEDIKRLKDRSVSLEEKLLIMGNHITKLLAFPVTVANILRVTQNESSGAADLAIVIKTDPAVSAEILKAANSIHFARGGARILNIKEAIVRIGFMESKKLALSLSVFKLKQHSNFTTGFNHIEFWFHSLAVAIIAERLARNSNLVNPEEAFIGGLLHDIGLLLLNEFFNPLYLEILDQSINESNQFIMCEATTLGMTHNHLMKILFTEWNFPQTLIAAVPFFSRPDIFKKEMLIKAPLAVIITIAEQIARNLSIGSDADDIAVPISTEMLQLMKYPYGLQKAVIENIYTSINTYNQVLKIDERTFPCTLPDDYVSPEILYCSFTDDFYNPVYDYCIYKGYSIKSARPKDDCMETIAGYDILVLSGVTRQHLDQIIKLSAIKTCNSKKPRRRSDENSNPTEPVPLKLILLTQDTSFNPSQIRSDNVTLLSYPVNLRSIDAIISCYVNNTSALDFTNNTPPQVRITDEAVSSAPLLIIHSNPKYRAHLTSIVSKVSGITVSEIDHLDKPADLKRIIKEPTKLIFLEFKSPHQAIETHEMFKLLSPSKPQLVIIYNAIKKEDILLMIKRGLTQFLSEADDDESVEKRLYALLASAMK